MLPPPKEKGRGRLRQQGSLWWHAATKGHLKLREGCTSYHDVFSWQNYRGASSVITAPAPSLMAQASLDTLLANQTLKDLLYSCMRA